jgi:non-ribosomal peptide synthetase component E (peptide arylation enzyme)
MVVVAREKEVAFEPRQPIDGVVYAARDDAARFVRGGAWETRTIGDALRECAKRVPSRTAYVCGDDRLTFAELDSLSERLAISLRGMGLKLHDRALFQMGTSIETAVALFGCFKAGVIPVCTIPQYRALEIGELAQKTRPTAYFVQGDAAGDFDLIGFAGEMARTHNIHHVVVSRGQTAKGGSTLQSLLNGGDPLTQFPNSEFNFADVAAFQLSGGSTGTPKIIPRYHGEYLGHVKSWCKRFGTEEGDTGIWALSMLHNAGMMFSVLRPVLFDAATVLVPRWDVETFFRAIERESVRHVFTIGPHGPAIASYPHPKRFDLSSVKLAMTLIGGELIERSIGVPTTNMFGITEGLVLTGTPTDPLEVRHSTVGSPCSSFDEILVLEPGGTREVPIGEAGELCFRGPSSLRGYYNAPEITAASLTSDGYFRTADMVRAVIMDGRKAYRFEGRLRDNINRGGEKFGTEDIEILIARHPDIADGKVVAMPDPVYGEKACAFLIPKPGRRIPTIAELGKFLLAQGLAKYKLPERVEQSSSFPVTRVGKLDRAALRLIIADKLTKEAAGPNQPTAPVAKPAVRRR